MLTFNIGEFVLFCYRSSEEFDNLNINATHAFLHSKN